jgi:hypothetical protein
VCSKFCTERFESTIKNFYHAPNFSLRAAQ